MAKKLLLLDCDGVILDSNRLIDEQVEKVEYRASDKYCDILNNFSEKCHRQLHRLEIERSTNEEDEKRLNSTIEKIRMLRREHFYFKDMVLEEVYPEYQNRIDYRPIYQLHNAYPGVVEKIKELSNMDLFDDIYVVSHYNSNNEALAKLDFFSRNLPKIKVILMKFHKEPFSLEPEDEEKNKKRERTNKILEFSKMTGITDFSMTSFFDDSLSICEEAKRQGVAHCVCKDETNGTLFLLEEAMGRALAYIDKSNDNGRGK